GDAEVHRRAPAVGVAQQREVRGTVRLGMQTAELHETSMRRPMRRNVWRYARPGVRVQRLYNVDRPAPGRDRARPSLDQWRWCLRWWWRWPRTFTQSVSSAEARWREPWKTAHQVPDVRARTLVWNEPSRRGLTVAPGWPPLLRGAWEGAAVRRPP